MKPIKTILALLGFTFVAVCAPLFLVAGGLSLATLPAAGNFDCANLLEIQGKADELWTDNNAKKDFIPKAEALRVIYEQTTARLDGINGQQRKDNLVKLIWVQDCSEEPGDCDTTTCSVDGDELSANCQTYQPTLCKQAAFIVNEDDLRSTSLMPEELIARGFLMKTKQLDELLAKHIIAELATVKGVNAYPGDYGTLAGSGVGGSETEIQSALWTASLFGYFDLASELNKFNNPFLLSGTNLKIAHFNAQAQYANADGKGDLNKFNSMPAYFDPFNMDTVNAPDFYTYMIDRGAVAFVPIWHYDDTPRKIDNVHTRYTVPSRTIPNMKYDVTYTTRCKAGTNKIEHVFNIMARGGFYLNPRGCDQNNTGVLAFKKVSGS